MQAIWLFLVGILWSLELLGADANDALENLLTNAVVGACACNRFHGSPSRFMRVEIQVNQEHLQTELRYAVMDFFDEKEMCTFSSLGWLSVSVSPGFTIFDTVNSKNCSKIWQCINVLDNKFHCWSFTADDFVLQYVESRTSKQLHESVFTRNDSETGKLNDQLTVTNTVESGAASIQGLGQVIHHKSQEGPVRTTADQGCNLPEKHDAAGSSTGDIAVGVILTSVGENYSAFHTPNKDTGIVDVDAGALSSEQYEAVHQALDVPVDEKKIQQSADAARNVGAKAQRSNAERLHIETHASSTNGVRLVQSTSYLGFALRSGAAGEAPSHIVLKIGAVDKPLSSVVLRGGAADTASSDHVVLTSGGTDDSLIKNLPMDSNVDGPMTTIVSKHDWGGFLGGVYGGERNCFHPDETACLRYKDDDNGTRDCGDQPLDVARDPNVLVAKNVEGPSTNGFDIDESDAHMHPSIPFTAEQPAVMQERLHEVDEVVERALPRLETSLKPLYLCMMALFASLVMLLAGWLEIEYRWDLFERSLRTNYGRKFTRSALRSTANPTASDATTHSEAVTTADGGGACCAADEFSDTSRSQEARSNADWAVSADAQLSMDGEKDWELL